MRRGPGRRRPPILARATPLLFGLMLWLLATSALAHKQSDAYLTLTTDRDNGHVLHGRWDIALRDLNFVFGIDSNHDGAITWGEVKAHRGVVERYARKRLTITGDGLDCHLRFNGQKIASHTDGRYAVLLFQAVCDKNIPNKLSLDYRLFADIDPSHRGIVTLHAGTRTAGAVLGPQAPSTRLNLREPDRWRQFKSFAVDGIWHIWTGIDHLLFIISLLLPAVLRRRSRAECAAETGNANAWVPVASFWPAFIEIAKVVTAFTLSHSVTLTLAVLGIVDLPSRLVESGIALSVIVAAGNNIVPLMRQRIWLIAFCFGFIHGLGFASALAGLSLPPAAMAASLGGFNIGVEIGQEAIVIAVMPLAFALRFTRFYNYYVLRWGSAAIIALATLWLVERAFNIVIPLAGPLLPR